jgi:iron complex transport system permease protein
MGLRLALLVAAVLGSVALATGLGPARISAGRVLAVLEGGGDAAARGIILGLRLPRAVQGCLVGGGLAVAGAAFQALLRNPLAEPYVLGVSGGAALGAVGAIVLGWAAAGPWSLPLAAFLGALLAVGLVLLVAARTRPALDTRVLLLAGVVAGAFFNALIMLCLSLGRVETFRSAIFWMMGSLSGAGWTENALLAAYVLPAAALLLALARSLDLLAVGEETALYLGTRVEWTKRAVYVATSLLVAATVSVAGAIGFVGLIVPHAIRLAWGSEHRLLLPASLLAGGAFVVLADTAARTVLAPAELPVGVVTAIIGVPLFVVLLVREAGAGREGLG